MANLIWKYSKREINTITLDNSKNDELLSFIDSWWITKENPENSIQNEIDRIEKDIADLIKEL